jgi:hypothetical protein
MAVYAGLGPDDPHVTIALDLTVNGEPVHLEQLFPLDAWDMMGNDERAARALEWMRRAVAGMVERYAENIAVTRHDRPRR